MKRRGESSVLGNNSYKDGHLQKVDSGQLYNCDQDKKVAGARRECTDFENKMTYQKLLCQISEIYFHTWILSGGPR